MGARYTFYVYNVLCNMCFFSTSSCFVGNSWCLIFMWAFFPSENPFLLHDSLIFLSWCMSVCLMDLAWHTPKDRNMIHDSQDYIFPMGWNQQVLDDLEFQEWLSGAHFCGLRYHSSMIDSWVIWKIHEDTPFADGSMARLLNGIVFWGVWGYSGIRLRENFPFGSS